jgi:DNA (cytosine-5)-methyltransferase 1
MKFGSVCSGIEAASVAWSPLGWQSVFFSEIEAFPSAVLSHRHPQTPNLGDMTKFKDWPDAAIDVLVGGTPCQSFSVAGLRKGLDDPRGNLTLTYLAIAARYRPGWLVWENVPGVLSSNGGRDFAAFLFGLGECGYGFAYRVLDAQYFGLAQRRKRVFVVASTRGWQSAAAVLFERASLSGNPAPRREAGKAVAPTIAGCSNGGGSNGPGRDVDSVETLQVVAMAHGQGGAEIASERSPTRTCNHEAPILFSPVTHTLRGEGFDASEDGTVRGTPLVPVTIAFHPTQEPISSTDVCHALGANANANATAAVAIGVDCFNGAITGDVAATLSTRSGTGCETGPTVLAFDTTQVTSKANVSNPKPGDPYHPLAAGAHAPAIATPTQVRRLTPRECERLQGFPDDYTAIPWRKKAADLCPDGPRYKSLGNSMAVPVMRWIGERIAMVDEIERSQKQA